MLFLREDIILRNKFLVSCLTLFFLISCSFRPSEPLRISTNLWIGYSPFFYIQQKGWLNESNIEILNVVSLSESMQIYESGFVDAFTGTEYEFKRIQKKVPDLEPIILLDRSLGGDIVMGNYDIATLQKAQKIDVYLEVDSISKVLLNCFTELYDINESVLHLINKDTDDSSMLTMKEEPTLIITYLPYDILLKKNGYQVLDTTKNLSLFVMDALYTDSETRKKYAKEFAVLNQLIAKALNNLKNDPEEYFSTVQVFFKYKDKNAFFEALDSIEWIYPDRSRELMKQLDVHHIPSKNILDAADEF